MNAIKTAFRNASALVLTLGTTAAVMAQATTAPTSAASLAATIDVGDAKTAALVVVALLVTLGVTLWGANMILTKFKPK
jgi:hypothetical protein